MAKTYKQIIKRQREYARKRLATRTEEQRLLDNAKHREYYQNNKEFLKEQVKLYKIKHPEYEINQKEYQKTNKEKIKTQQKTYAIKNKEKLYKYGKEYRLKKQFNLTIEQYNKMFKDQKGCCAICGIHQSSLSHILGVDHNHKTGEIRELLCHKCNLILGHSKDTIKILGEAIKYLRKHSGNLN